jgi:hypothetical protein
MMGDYRFFKEYDRLEHHLSDRVGQLGGRAEVVLSAAHGWVVPWNSNGDVRVATES